jgi:hypothetical protein
MNRPYTLLILLGVFCVLASCRSKVTQNVKANYRDSVADLQQWKLIKLDTESFYQPLGWKTGKQAGYNYFAYLNNGDKAKYFSIVKYKMSDKGLTPLVYLHEMYKTWLNNKTEIFDGYNVKKQVIGKNEIYCSQIFTTIGNRKLLNYSLIFTDNDYLYNIGVKIERPEYLHYKTSLDNIVFNLKINDKYIFDPDANIASERVIDLSKL